MILQLTLYVLYFIGQQNCACTDTTSGTDDLLSYSLCSCRLTFDDAEFYCSEEYGGHLATVANDATKSYLIQEVLGDVSSDVWLGLKGTVADWHWESSE